MAESDLFLGRVGEWMALRNVRISVALEVDLRIIRKPMIPAIVKEQPVGNPGGRLGARPDIKSRLRHGGNTHPFARDITVPNNQQSQRASIKNGIFPSNQIQLPRIHSS